MSEPKYVDFTKYKNKARCLNCLDEIESTHRHDFQSCSCGDIFVDGGNEYWRAGFRVEESFERIWEAIDG